MADKKTIDNQQKLINKMFPKRPPNKTVEDRQAKRVGVCKVCGKTGSNYGCKVCYKETPAT